MFSVGYRSVYLCRWMDGRPEHHPQRLGLLSVLLKYLLCKRVHKSYCRTLVISSSSSFWFGLTICKRTKTDGMGLDDDDEDDSDGIHAISITIRRTSSLEKLAWSYFRIHTEHWALCVPCCWLLEDGMVFELLVLGGRAAARPDVWCMR